MGISKAQLQLEGKSFAWHCRQRFSGFRSWCAVGAFGSEVVEDLRGVPWLDDTVADRGPLEGLSVGLAWAHERAIWAFVSTIDVPLIETRLASVLLEAVTSSSEIVMPSWGGHRYGLTALYKSEIAGRLRKLVDDGFRKVSDLPLHFETQLVDEATVRGVDPHLNSFSRINTPEEYQAFFDRFGSGQGESRKGRSD
jgi:molybdopterin-guanine dinucleotide biosynthesis protein A